MSITPSVTNIRSVPDVRRALAEDEALVLADGGMYIAPHPDAVAMAQRVIDTLPEDVPYPSQISASLGDVRLEWGEAKAVGQGRLLTVYIEGTSMGYAWIDTQNPSGIKRGHGTIVEPELPFLLRQLEVSEWDLQAG